MNPDDPTTPDTARCDICGGWKPREEMGYGVKRSGIYWFCDSCQEVWF